VHDLESGGRYGESQTHYLRRMHRIVRRVPH
jgi:hypothetical protein